MKSTKRIIALTTTLLIVFLIGVACGGGNHGGGTTGGSTTVTAVRKFAHHLIGGARWGTRTTTTASLFSPFSVFAATPVTIGNIDGVCAEVPNGETTFYNLGRYSDTHCDQNYANFSNDGYLIEEAMQATNLSVVASSAAGGATDGVVVVKVNSVPTVLKCTLGATRTCKSNQIINLVANDQVTATINGGSGAYRIVRMKIDFQQ